MFFVKALPISNEMNVTYTIYGKNHCLGLRNESNTAWGIQ